MVLLRIETTYDPRKEPPQGAFELPFLDAIGRGRAFYADIRPQLAEDMHEGREAWWNRPEEDW